MIIADKSGKLFYLNIQHFPVRHFCLKKVNQIAGGNHQVAVCFFGHGL